MFVLTNLPDKGYAVLFQFKELSESFDDKYVNYFLLSVTGKTNGQSQENFFMLFADLFSYEPESVGSGSSSIAAFFHGRRVLLDVMT